MSQLKKQRNLLWLTHVATLLTLLFVLGGPFRTGWFHLETDFPNYYTAAKLVHQGQSLSNYYDWTWFVRQMNYAGVERQIGAYTPQTPLTMLPMLGFTRFSAQHAKQLWLLCNLMFLGMTVWLLSRATHFTSEEVWLLAFCGFFSLRTNFLYGQYYLFLLFLLTLTFFCLDRARRSGAGILTGVAFGLKLYGGPFLLYFAVKREWKVVFGMIVCSLVLLAGAIVLFGWNDIHYYFAQVLPRTLEGGSVDPYNPGSPTISSLLRHLFVQEPELNPAPLWHAPALFFFLRAFMPLAIIAFTLSGIAVSRATERHDFAWFIIAVLMLSTSVASYTFILLLLPVVLLLEECRPLASTVLVSLYVLLTLPLPLLWLFPKVWLLFCLYLFVGWSKLRKISWKFALGLVAVVVAVSAIDAQRHLSAYRNEPGQRCEGIGKQKGALFSGFPAVSKAGLFYQSMGSDRYVLRWIHDNVNEELIFEGHALQPRVATDGQSIDFELVANRTSTIMRFDPSTRRTTPQPMSVLAGPSSSSDSPDGKWTAYESAQTGSSQIWLRNRSTGEAIVLTGGNCNNTSPTWELDSKAVIFASDCERAFGLPMLYRANLFARKN